MDPLERPGDEHLHPDDLATLREIRANVPPMREMMSCARQAKNGPDSGPLPEVAHVVLDGAGNPLSVFYAEFLAQITVKTLNEANPGHTVKSLLIEDSQYVPLEERQP